MNTAPTNLVLEDRQQKFDDSIVSHPKLGAVYTEVSSLIKRPTIPIIEVMGPTGVGKSTLLNKFHQEALKSFSAAMAVHPGLIPVIKVEAVAPENGMFQWSDFYVRILQTLNEPMIDCKTVPQPSAQSVEHSLRKTTLNSMRWAVEQAIRHRGTRIIIIDEAQHLTKVPNARRLADQMDAIKSLSSLANVQFVLVGTYELHTLLNQNGQLARRIRSVHFSRYDFSDETDRQAFINILSMFEKRLPIEANNLLLDLQEYVYEKCLGCVGILKDLLRMAAGRAIQAGRNKLLKCDLEHAALATASLRQIFQEISEGEAAVAKCTQESGDLAVKLGLRTKPPSNGNSAKPIARQVGQRNPQRDPIGIPHVHTFAGTL